MDITVSDTIAYELEFWQDCRNTFREEQKQLVYAARMGLRADWSGGHPPFFDLNGRSVIDVGGGPVSLLLKCVNLNSKSCVVDPAPYPDWVMARYKECGIQYWPYSYEDMGEPGEPHGHYDEAWIYNVLQHVRDPEKIITNARRDAKIIRIFEWIEIDPYPGHPHRLDKVKLDKWLDSFGFVAHVDENGAHGRCYYGVFQTHV